MLTLFLKQRCFTVYGCYGANKTEMSYEVCVFFVKGLRILYRNFPLTAKMHLAILLSAAQVGLWMLDVLVHCTHCVYGAVLLCCLCCVMWLEMSLGKTHPSPNCNFSPTGKQSKEQKLLICNWSMTTAQPPADTRIARITCNTTQSGVFELADTVAL